MNHLDNFSWDPGINVFVDQAKDFVKKNLIAASIIDNIFTLQESYIARIRKDINNAYKRDMLKIVFQNSLQLSSGHIFNRKRLLSTSFLIKLALFIKAIRWSFFSILRAETSIEDLRFVVANFFLIKVA